MIFHLFYICQKIPPTKCSESVSENLWEVRNLFRAQNSTTFDGVKMFRLSTFCEFSSIRRIEFDWYQTLANESPLKRSIENICRRINCQYVSFVYAVILWSIHLSSEGENLQIFSTCSMWSNVLHFWCLILRQLKEKISRRMYVISELIHCSTAW